MPMISMVQAYYLDQPLACESAKTEALPFPAVVPSEQWRSNLKDCVHTHPRVKVTRLTRGGYPVNGFVLELECSLSCQAAVPLSSANPLQQGGGGKWLPPLSEECVQVLSAAVGGACIRLQEANVPHNLLIVDGGRRVFLWPQCFAERMASGEVPARVAETGVNPAVFEIAGHLLLKHSVPRYWPLPASPCCQPTQAVPGICCVACTAAATSDNRDLAPRASLLHIWLFLASLKMLPIRSNKFAALCLRL